jgi:hypothetical protein
MPADWKVVATIASPIIGGTFGFFLNRWFADRAKLVVYYGHVASFSLQPAPPGQPANVVHTHAIVVANIGRKLANNVRVSHGNGMPPNVRVFPDTEFQTQKLPGGGDEIILPRLVSKQSITISYLYFPPLTFDRIATTVSSDEGFAKKLDVVPMEPAPKWLRRVGLLSLVWLATTMIYGAYTLVRHVVS